MPTSADATWGG